MGSLYAVLQFFFAPIWGGYQTGLVESRFYVYTDWNSMGFFWIMAGDFVTIVFSCYWGHGGGISQSLCDR